MLLFNIALNDLYKILNILNLSTDKLVPGDNEEMSRLGDDLTRLEGEYAEQGLGARIATLQEETTEQKAMIAGYKEDIAALEAQVANLENIADTIPETCSATQEVESE